MKKILPLLLILILFSSCQSTEVETTPEDVVIVDSIEEVVEIDVQEVEEKVVEEAPIEEVIPIVEEEVVEEAVEIEEEIVEEEPLTESVPMSEVPSPLPREIVEEITEMYENANSTEEITVVEEEEVISEVEEVTLPPIEEEEEAEVVEEVEASSPFDSYIGDRTLTIMIELVVIVILLTLASVIRNKFARPLPFVISLVLTLLFVAIPMLITWIIMGYSHLLLLYLSVFISIFVFCSKEKRL